MYFILISLLTLFQDEDVLIDGKLSELIWTNAQLVTEFKQIEPQINLNPTLPVSVRIAENSEYLFIGVELSYQKQSQIYSSQRTRDADLNNDDFLIKNPPGSEFPYSVENVVSDFSFQSNYLSYYVEREIRKLNYISDDFNMILIEPRLNHIENDTFKKSEKYIVLYTKCHVPKFIPSQSFWDNNIKSVHVSRRLVYITLHMF